jgi:CBS domain-containing protein
VTNKTSVHSVPVSQVMTSDVRTATPQTTLAEIGEILVETRCHHVPIVDAGQVVGIVSSRDLVDAARARGARSLSGSEAGSLAASEVMSTDPESIEVDGSIDAAIRRIGEGDIHALIVLDRSDALVGIVTHRDLLRYLMN